MSGLNDADKSWVYHIGNEPRHLEEVAEYLLRQIKSKFSTSNLLLCKNVQVTTGIVRYLGLDGKPAISAANAGKLSGYSSAGIMNITKKLLGRISDSEEHHMYQPCPQVLEDSIEAALEQPLNLGEKLQNLGLTHHSQWNYGNLALLARLCGAHKSANTVEKAGVIANNLDSIRKTLPKTIWELSQLTGFCHISLVVKELSNRESIEVDVKLLHEMIATEPQILKLPEGVLFYASSIKTKNDEVIELPSGTQNGCRIPKLIERQLKISSPLSVNELLKGVHRELKVRQITTRIPVETLKMFLNLHQDFVVDSNQMVSTNKDLIRNFSDETLVGWLFSTLRESEYGCLTYDQVINLARQEGRNSNSLNIYLTYYCEIRKDQRGFYYLVGEPPYNDLLDQAEISTKANKIASEIGYSLDADMNILTIEIKVGTSALNGVVQVKTKDYGLLDLIGDNRLPIIDSDEERHGWLSVSDSFKAIKGLATFFTHKSVVAGEKVILRVGLDEKIARGIKVKSNH